MEQLFYHATTEGNWDKIQKEGVLWGVRDILNNDGTIDTRFNPDRCTYLALEKENAVFGKGDGSGEWAEVEVLLKVRYDPDKNPKMNVLIDWQMRVYEPILIDNCKRIK